MQKSTTFANQFGPTSGENRECCFESTIINKRK